MTSFPLCLLSKTECWLKPRRVWYSNKRNKKLRQNHKKFLINLDASLHQMSAVSSHPWTTQGFLYDVRLKHLSILLLINKSNFEIQVLFEAASRTFSSLVFSATSALGSFFSSASVFLLD